MRGVAFADLSDKELLGVPVARAAIQNALCGKPVASGASSLLVVSLQAGGNVVVNHETMSDLLIPMPKALVATTTAPGADMKAS